MKNLKKSIYPNIKVQIQKWKKKKKKKKDQKKSDNVGEFGSLLGDVNDS